MERSNLKTSKDSQTKLPHLNLNNIETARSYPSRINKNEMEKVKNGFQSPRNHDYNYDDEKQEADKARCISEPTLTDANQKVVVRLESHSGANCCTDFDKKCLIF